MNYQASVDKLKTTAMQANAAMYPGYFALVMATGIVSTALLLTGYKTASGWLFALNTAAYPTLIVATALRAAFFPRALWRDLTNPGTVFLSFTFVAGTGVLGVQFALRSYTTIALGLWAVAATTWLVLSYFSIGVLTFKNAQTPPESINASWLIAIVGTQSVVVLGTILAPHVHGQKIALLVAMCGMWGIGVALYLVFITLVIYRLFFVRMDAAEMMPPYWIVLGATAISSLSGATLLQAAGKVAFLHDIAPMIEGLTLLLWAWSTWWIPMLVIFGIWRHGIRGAPLRYHPSFWSLVFPIGMYTVATFRLAVTAGIPLLASIPRVMVWVASAAWTVTMLGLLRSIANWIRVAVIAEDGNRQRHRTPGAG
ncbi:MAG: tellurite resistance/C4-dicarboxylate transporter family protein [Armatimonadetes bacterium]|nr:tellurite resistance/C4-dicarboxylate transporter family protein [Armatimonadota bacterium]MDE2205774.1 tellurite resistance/C4-dicarboxylate transporter family protein [Armatimonadota bacterium]